MNDDIEELINYVSTSDSEWESLKDNESALKRHYTCSTPDRVERWNKLRDLGISSMDDPTLHEFLQMSEGHILCGVSRLMNAREMMKKLHLRTHYTPLGLKVIVESRFVGRTVTDELQATFLDDRMLVEKNNSYSVAYGYHVMLNLRPESK